MNILIVDDDPGIRAVLCEALRMHGHQTAACEDANTAISLLPYVDGCICDGLDFDCFAVVARAHLLDKPMVIYTGDEAIAQAAVVGQMRIVRKPGSIAELLAAVALEEVAA